MMFDEQAGRFGAGRPAAARAAGRTSSSLQPSLGAIRGSTTPDSSDTAELTEALHRRRGCFGCANSTTVDYCGVACSQISVVELILSAPSGSSYEIS